MFLAEHAVPSVPGYMLIQWAGAINGLLFVFAFGAIVGSFINVVVYRLPRGLNLISPPSACPRCETRLTWRENFPILGWLWLGGRCRFCRSRISPEYPLVEALVAVLFSLVYAMWFMDPHIPGLDPESWRPDWAQDGLARMWPTALLTCWLIASLVAVTLIDARTFTIPLSIPWLVGLAALVVHPLHALAIQLGRGGRLRWSDTGWTMPTPDGPWLGAALCGAGGLVVANVLLRLGVLRRSFEDYEAWERRHLQHAEAVAGSGPGGGDPAETPGVAWRVVLLRTLFLTGPAVALMALGFSLGLSYDRPVQGMAAGTATGLLIGVLLRRLVAKRSDASTSAEPPWVQYPHARREMIRELAFLAPAVGAVWLGWWLFGPGPFAGALDNPPLWLRALGGSVAGLLVGGGLVWGVRILGTFIFDKEAMGLGDVHLMAAVGAVLGWADPTLAFFIAPFMGLGWALGTTVLGRWFRLQGTALPYGPHLALATVVVIFLKPWLEAGLGLISGRSINLP